MARKLTASDRKALIRLASTLPKGSPERRTILARLALESETFDLMDQLSPDFGATEGGAWVDDVTYGKPRWDKSQGKMVRPYKAQVSGEIIGSVDGGPEAYKEALMGMASWSSSRGYPSLETKINLQNGLKGRGIIMYERDDNFLLIALIGFKYHQIPNGWDNPSYWEAVEAFSDFMRRPPSGFFIESDNPHGYSALEDEGVGSRTWGVTPTDPAQDLKKAKAALKKVVAKASEYFGKI